MVKSLSLIHRCGYIVLHMAEGEYTPTSEQGKGPGKRPPWWKRFWGWTQFAEKSGWEYLQLLGILAIPFVIALGTLWFTVRHNEQQRLIEERRAQAERELEDQRAQDATLEAYLDQIGPLLLEKKNLGNSEEGREVRPLARARTLRVLRHLDPTRKPTVIRFLAEANLVQSVEGAPIISLSSADLSGADLGYADLSGADLFLADLSGADLTGASLSYVYMRDANLAGANLSETFLSGAILAGANLSDANLSGAILSVADLDGADLDDANLGSAGLVDAVLSEANLSKANLRDANLEEADLEEADLSGADLSDANLGDTSLGHADLREATLSGADLGGADLSYADLRGANLSGAYKHNSDGSRRMVTNEELEEEQAASLAGATMPDGQQYEDWLKSNGRRKDGENSGSS